MTRPETEWLDIAVGGGAANRQSDGIIRAEG
jgi:hypothetical protein